MFSLIFSFSNSEFEKKYQKDCDSVKLLNFYQFILVEMALSFLLLLFEIIVDGINRVRLVLIIIVPFICLLIYGFDFCFRRWKYINSVYILVHIGILFMTIELLSQTRGEIDPNIYILKALTYASPLQVLFCSILIAQLKWGFSILFSIVFQAFFMLRLFTFSQIQESPLIIVLHLLCVIVFSMMSYYQEKTTRSLYKMINDSNGRLINFEILLKNIIPSPIFILDVGNQSHEVINISACKFLDSLNIPYENSVYNAVETLLLAFKAIDPNKDVPKLGMFYKSFTKEESEFEFLKIEVSLKKEDMAPLVYYHLKFLKLEWNSKPCILFALDDITEAHRIQELRNLDQYKDQLLATVSHDLRTPLNGMLGMMEMISLNLKEKKDKKNMSIAMASGQLLLSMINDILDFSQINNKKLRLNMLTANLIEILKQTSKLIKFQAKSKGIKFILKTHEITEAVIKSDSNRIRQILLNLLNNALKFTPSGYIQLSIKKTFDYDYNGYLFKLKVKDSGIGIKDEDLPKLFKLFGKLDLKDAEINKSGVGLGLTISQNLAKMLSPRIKNNGVHLKSESGIGSKFWFYLEGERNEDNFPCMSPQIPKKNVPYMFLTSSEDIFEKTRSKETVLIVDDDIVNLMVATKYCEYFGVEFLTANNGAEAIEVLVVWLKENKEINGIFMDCNMPILDGFKATTCILELFKKDNIKEIPIIGMTANVLQDDLEKCLQCGMTSYLCKPVSRCDFGKALCEVFKIRVNKI